MQSFRCSSLSKLHHCSNPMFGSFASLGFSEHNILFALFGFTRMKECNNGLKFITIRL